MYNIMIDHEPQFPVVYTWSNSEFTIYSLRKTYRPDKIIPRESLISPKIDEGCVEYNGQYYEVNGTICSLDRMHDWHFGSVYAIIEHDYADEVTAGYMMFGTIKRARFSLVNMTPIMVAHDCSDVVAAYTVYRDMQVDPQNFRLCGYLIVISDKRTIVDNILVTLTTDLERELSLRPAVRYEQFNIEQALRDIEDTVIPYIDLECPATRPNVVIAESVSRSSGWTAFPVQLNEPFCIDFAINKRVTAQGYIPYYTIGCTGFGRLTVNDHCCHFSRLVLQLSNCAIYCNSRLDATAPRIVTQWLFKHEYHLIEDYRGDEKKVRYHRYY